MASSVTRRAASVSELKLAAAIAAVIGVFLIWGVGFAGAASIHEAAHDSRHSLSFPCH